MALEQTEYDVNDKRQLRYAVYLCLSFLVYFLFMSLRSNYTGDTGDSITHFLFSKYSWQHPEYFFDLWAKPVFTFLSSPFSQFGMEGMKVFNSIVVSSVLFISCLLAQSLKIRSWFLIPFIIVFSSLYGVHIFSGLTEYLYSLLIVGSIYLAWKEKYLFAVLICSLLPFARNEGILPIVLMAVYLLWQKQYKFIPLLAFGYILVGFLGVVVVGYDWHWVITTGTYDPNGSQYGKGEFWVFIKHLRYVMDWPNVVLVILGLLALVLDIFKVFSKNRRLHLIIILVYGNFLGFYLGHAILYELGRFGSMGLPRVLFSVVPLAAIIAVLGLEWVLQYFPKSFRLIFIPLIALYIVAYPHLPRPAAHHWNGGDLHIQENDLIDTEVIPYLSEKGYNKETMYFCAPYFSIPLERNILNLVPGKTFIKAEDLPSLPSGSVFLWDDWYAVVEGKITKEVLLENGFVEEKCFNVEYWKGNLFFCVFKKS